MLTSGTARDSPEKPSSSFCLFRPFFAFLLTLASRPQRQLSSIAWGDVSHEPFVAVLKSLCLPAHCGHCSDACVVTGDMTTIVQQATKGNLSRV